MSSKKKSLQETVRELLGVDNDPDWEETRKEFELMFKERMSLGDVPYVLKLKEGADVEAILAYCKEPGKTYSSDPAEIKYVPSTKHLPGYIYGHATRVMAELMFDCSFEALQKTHIDTSEGEVEYIAWYTNDLPKPPPELKNQILEVIIPEPVKN